jgi:peptidyl-dipeptidase Dcp
MSCSRLLVVLALGLAVRLAGAAPAGAPPVNPLLEEWRTPFGVPPFGDIKPEHYLPALRAGIARHRQELAAIGRRRAAPTFANTIEALDDSGELLERVSLVFSGVRAAETSDALQALAREVAPLLSKHTDDIYLDPALFKRVKAVHDGRQRLRLPPAAARLVEKTYRDFVRGGAALRPAGRDRLRQINQELALLAVRFEDNVLKETNGFRLVVERSADLAGLPEGLVAAAAQAAQAAGRPGRWVFTLHGPSVMPFLEHARRRALRERIFAAYVSRADHGDERDNKAVIATVAALRAEKAALLGYRTFADYVLAENMAQSPDGVRRLLDQVWPRALANARREAAALQAQIDAEKGGFRLAPWDWRYYAERLRKSRFDVDDEALRPYFALDQVRAGAFDVAQRLYGLKFRALEGLPTYHPEVRAFEVTEADGRHLGVLLVDYHPRPGKKSGAWMGYYRRPWVKGGARVAPVVVNVGNFSRPAPGQPALLGADEVRTLFHEFGHALQGLLSQARYRKAGGLIPRDFVELPSQVMENWAMEPAVLARYARHHRTGAPIPAALVRKLQAARAFNQGFVVTELAAAALLDMEWHTLTSPRPVDTAAFERQALAKIGLIPEIVVRYRSTYFSHVMGGYAAGYYGYLWGQVLDADAFAAFKEAGDLFDPATARRFREQILEPGGSEDPAELYRRFRGRDPDVGPFLTRRGLK